MSNTSFMNNSKQGLNSFLEKSKRGFTDFKKRVTTDFNKQLNMLTLLVFIVTVVVLLVILFFSGVMTHSSFYFSIIQYVAIGILSLIISSYFALAYFWLSSKKSE